jgi:hypothetical protein
MDGVRQAGYTVVEVTLFLGITGLLFLIVLIGTGTSIRSIRFSDSNRSMVAFVQRQYDDIINGLNTRPGQESCSGGVVSTGTSQTPGTSNCLLLGKLLVFNLNSSRIDLYNVIGSEPASVDYAQTDQQLVSAFNPTVITNSGVTSYDIPWGAVVSGTKRLSDSKAVTALALIRSPKSSRILSYTFKPQATVTTALVDLSGAVVVNDTANLGKTTNFCVKNADGIGLPAKMVVTDAPTQSAVQVVFDADSSGSECNGT